MRRSVRILLSGLLASLAACSLTRELKSVPTVLALTVPMPAGTPNGAAPRTWQLQVETVQADPLRGGAHVLRRAGAELGAYAAVAWSEPVADLWQRLLVTGLAPMLPGIARAGSPLHSDCRLLPELERFEVVLEPSASASIGLSVSLLHSASGRLLARQSFTAAGTLEGQGAAALGRAFQRALDQLWPRLADWVLATGDAGCATAPD